MRSRIHRRRQGYVLLMTLAVILICSVLLVGFAEFSLSHVAVSKQSERQLQSKWGTASCTRIALARHRELLNQRQWNDEIGQWVMMPQRESENSVVLGDQLFVLSLVDESSKVDINFLLEQTSEQEVEQLISSLTNYQLPIDLRLLEHLRDKKEDPVESWGQVFVYDEFNWPNMQSIRNSTEEITCWSKRLNIHTASDEALFQSAKVIVGSATATRLKKARSNSRYKGKQELLAELNLNERHRKLLSELLTDTSQSQAIWIENRSRSRTETTLHIQETIVEGVQRIHSFSW